MTGFDPKTETTVVLIILLQFPKQLVEFRPVGLCQGEFAVFSRQDMLVRRLAQSFNQSINHIRRGSGPALTSSKSSYLSLQFSQ
jgi:hypothetical protein